MIRSDPSFTPYYALVGQDVSRLTYLAEVQLEAAARDLPAGLPLWVGIAP
jgi:HlyD family secretion protein